MNLLKDLKSVNFVILAKVQICISLCSHGLSVKYLADQTPIQLTIIIYQGALYFRFPDSGRRISYQQLKKGIDKKTN
jgi:hypothetical protein